MNMNVAVATPNQSAPQRERSAPKYPRASGSNRAAQATEAVASAIGGPSSQAIGGEMMLYAGV